MAAHKKIKSGILGLNGLLDGGFVEHSSTVVIGASGAGKTTIATQFLRRGLLDGQEGIYITLDEPPDQIVSEAGQMGFRDIEAAIEDETLIFIDASGKQFKEFILKELQDFVASWGSSNARIAVDPLTPVLWSTISKYEQRELLSFLFKQAKRIGTVLATLEEHSPAADLSSPETAIPMYLADNIIHLQYRTSQELASHSLRVLKTRSSKHSNEVAPYEIRKGLGVVVRPSGRIAPGAGEGGAPSAQWQRVIREKVESKGLPPAALARLRELLAEIDAEPVLGIGPGELIDLILEDVGTPK